MIERIRKFDRGLARGESVLVAVLLLSMIFFALIQAGLGILKDNGIGWAIDARELLKWIDPFLQTATAWLAFLGASLATHYDKHIAIDIVGRLIPHKGKLLVGGVTKVGAGIVGFFLALAYMTQIVDYNSSSIPFELSVLSNGDSVHICDAPPEALQDLDEPRPTVFCSLRGVILAIGGEEPVPADEAHQSGEMRAVAPVLGPVGASLYIIPVMFLIMAMRLLFKGMGAFIALGTGTDLDDGRPSIPGFSGDYHMPDPEELEKDGALEPNQSSDDEEVES